MSQIHNRCLYHQQINISHTKFVFLRLTIFALLSKLLQVSHIVSNGNYNKTMPIIMTFIKYLMKICLRYIFIGLIIIYFHKTKAEPEGMDSDRKTVV